MINKGFIKILLAIIGSFIFACFNSSAKTLNYSDSLYVQDTIINSLPDTVVTDTIVPKNAEKHDIESPVKYSATDSLDFDWEKKTVHLYGDAKVEYQNIELTAAYIEFDMTNQNVYATGIEDSTGKLQGVPHFKEGSEEFDAHWIKYNFKTRKGFVYFVKTKQSEGTLIGDSTKRNPNGHVHLKGAKFSTCDLDHPHFYLRLTKAKAVPNDKIVSGPAYLVMADIPLPLILPFGYFPNTKGVSSGLLLPTWGQERARGFNLRNAGYYFAVNDYFDGRFTADIYSKGSWATHLQTNYKLRYRFTGGLLFDYANNVTSEKGLPNYSVQKDFRFSWNHSQDSKANPTSTFSANVNLSSSSYDQNNSYNSEYLTNTKSSSVSYSKRWANAPFNFSASMNHSQNSRLKQISMTAPNISFSMNPIYPFRKEESMEEPKWYEDVQFTYSSRLENRIETTDSLFLTNRMFDKMNNGFSHSIPLSKNFKITRFINLSPQISYDGMLYNKYQKITNNPETGDIETTIEHGLSYAHTIKPSINLGYAPKIYGMFLFKNSKIKAIRHVMSPTIGLSFIPDISNLMPDYRDTYEDKDGRIISYSYYDGSLYGSPSLPPGKSASISFGLNNNLEMKYLPSSDTSNKDTKVPILENLNFSGSYNLMADSFNLSTINMNTGTRLFNDKFNIQLTAVFDPYARNQQGKKIDYFAISRGQGLAYLTSANISVQTQFRSGDNKSTPKEKTDLGNPSNLGLENDFDDDVVDYSIPWSVNVNYNISYSKPQQKSEIIQSMSLSGDLSVTKKWKIGFSTNYDFTNNQIAYTRFNLSRDLHCWEMRFDWVPFGSHTNYNFTINALGLLQDLKYTKRQDWRDY